MTSVNERVVVITGPTASGNERLAFELAQRLDAEIISMDSMKVYREIEIATAKPPPEHVSKVRFHLLGFVDPHEEFSTGAYLEHLEMTLRELRSRRQQPIVAGGTALYLKGFLDGFRVGPDADWELRNALLKQADAEGVDALYRRLQREDPVAAEKINPTDLRRIVRALEICDKTGRRASEAWTWGQSGDSSVNNRPERRVELFGIEWERPLLYARINRRVEAMVRKGLFEEAERLATRKPPPSRSAAQSIGYKEIVDGMARGLSRAEIAARVQQGSRRFAKRQMTWFRKFPIHWISARESEDPRVWADEVLRALE